MTNRVTVTNQLILRSVNGPDVTIIEGNRAITRGTRCIDLRTNALLTGFTLSNGAGGHVVQILTNGLLLPDFGVFGGGVRGLPVSTISNCVIVGNQNGAYGGKFLSCTFSNHTEGTYGGGASGATLIDCTLSSNSANAGGGAYNSVLSNCVVISNVSGTGGGGVLEPV